jgi:hypothetical protein
MKTRFVRKFIVLSIFSLLVISSTAFAQINVQFLLSPTLQNAKIVYISNFDLLQQGTGQFLFQVTIENQAGEEQIGKLHFEIVKDGEPIISAITNDFRLPAQPPIVSFNNIQLNTGFMLPNGDFITFDDQSVQTPTDEFQQETLQGGKLPGGQYFFYATFIKTFTNEEFPAPPLSIEVISSPYVFPVAPGTSDLAAPEIIYSPFPVFQFNTNLSDPLALLEEPFLVQVYRKLDFHTSADEVLTTTPHLEYRTGAAMFQYPQGQGEQPLEPGSYLWRVQMVLPTTSGTEIIQSPIFAFKFMDPTNASEDMVARASAEEVLRLLRYLIGQQADVYAEMLNAYSLTTIRINGEVIELSDLYGRIARFEGKVFRLSDLELLSSQN